jgi:FMN phosphatase YigB (HAD superfamily)
MSENYKIIVFDLDETLGYFQELSFFIDALEYILNKKITKQHFYELLDRYPEFLRPQILTILSLLKRTRSNY